RTRNAQVELYQSGQVDYLVATDAIGMGLNLDVDHIAFASDRKFDGYQFRNSDLDFSSIGALQATLGMAPTENALARAPVAEDILVLDHAARDDEVRNLIGTRADVERLWDVCQLPDYRKIAPANHAELVVTVFGYLQREGKIAVDWFGRQIE